MLEGNAALKSGQTTAAVEAFTRAFDRAVRPSDKAYAQERLIATARQAGTLSALADEWPAQKDLPAERLLPLATVLRELGRTAELLAWWRAGVADPARAETLSSDRLVTEVLGAAQAAGRSDDAVAISRQRLDRDPDSRPWLTATLRALLGLGRTTEADALLDTRLQASVDAPDQLLQIGRSARSFGRYDGGGLRPHPARARRRIPAAVVPPTRRAIPHRRPP